jgi:hypothetical protein
MIDADKLTDRDQNNEEAVRFTLRGIVCVYSCDAHKIIFLFKARNQRNFELKYVTIVYNTSGVIC